MAEFSVVIQELQRMCSASTCMDCPFRGEDVYGEFECMFGVVAHKPACVGGKTCEQVIMEWAKANPVG